MSSPCTAKPDNKARTAFVGVLTGLFAVGCTVTGAITSNSVALLADMIGTFFEFLAILFSWLTLRRMAKPSGSSFEYGYGKLEHLVSMAIAICMFLSLSIVAFNAMRRFVAPTEISGFGVWMMLGAHLLYVGVNGSLCWKTGQSMRREPSTLQQSQRRLFAIKTFANLTMGSALALSLALRGIPAAMYIDPAMSLLIAALMFLGAYRIVHDNLGALLDCALGEEAQLHIMKVLSEFYDDYVQFHGIRSRRSGNRAYIEIFLEFDGALRMAEVQGVLDRMGARMTEVLPDSVVSIVPSTQRPAA
jgi:ferrous-iron efflux pump FieF